MPRIFLLWTTAALLALPRLAAAGADVFFDVTGPGDAAPRFLYTGGPAPVWITNESLWVVLGSGSEAQASGHKVALRLRFDAAPAHIRPTGATGLRLNHYRGRATLTRLVARKGWRELEFRRGNAAPHLVLAAGRDGLCMRIPADGTAQAPMRLELAGARLLESDDSQASRAWVATPSGARPLPIAAEGATLTIRDTAGGAMEKSLSPATSGCAGEGLGAVSRAANQGDAIGVTYGSFLGAGLVDEAAAVSLAGNRVYIAGHTQSLDFPTAPGLSTEAHAVNAFVAAFDRGGAGAGYITVLQGSDLFDGEEYVLGLSPAGEDSIYAAGNTNSSDFPVTDDAFQTAYGGNVDAFVLLLDVNGELEYSTLFGGAEFDAAQAVGQGGDGGVFIAGGTWSGDLPTTPDARGKSNNGERDAFLARFDPTLGSLEYGSYAGGSSQDQAEGLALDATGRALITGWTRSADFPALRLGARRDAARQTSPFDAFVVRFDPAGGEEYELGLGGSDEDRGFDLAVDGDGNAVLTGRSASFDFPVSAGAFGESYGGGTCSFAPCPDIFVSKIAPDGATLVFSGLLAAGDWDEASAVNIDENGAVHVAGWTSSTDFPASSDALDAVLDGGSDAFYARIAADGASLEYATLIGGLDEDRAAAIDVQAGGQVALAGKTRSSDFPVSPDALDASINGDHDAFVLVLGIADATDSDLDGVPDAADNCLLIANPPQRDSDADGFGNFCDGDLNGDCNTNFVDLGAMKAVFLSPDPDADLNGDNSVNFIDLGLMKSMFLSAPGPSALAQCP